jgi:formate dehydrogenase iron-sulfur subunit
MCAELCATKALLAGDAQVISDIFRERVAYRGAKEAGWNHAEPASTDPSSTPTGGAA